MKSEESDDDISEDPDAQVEDDEMDPAEAGYQKGADGEEEEERETDEEKNDDDEVK